MNPIKKFAVDPIKAAALRLAKQMGAARDFAVAKANRQPKKVKRTKEPYEYGKLGLSAVSEAIQKDYGRILSRRERKSLAKQQGIAFKVYYNN